MGRIQSLAVLTFASIMIARSGDSEDDIHVVNEARLFIIREAVLAFDLAVILDCIFAELTCVGIS